MFSERPTEKNKQHEPIGGTSLQPTKTCFFPQVRSCQVRLKFVKFVRRSSEVRQVRQKFVKSSSSLSQVRQIRRRPGWGPNWESKQLIFLILVGKTAYFLILGGQTTYFVVKNEI
jgi:hypothetical protein